MKVIHQIDSCTLRDIERVEPGLSGSWHTKVAQLLATFDSDEGKFKGINVSWEEFQCFISDLYSLLSYRAV